MNRHLARRRVPRAIANILRPATLALGVAAGALEPFELRCEYATNPLGVDVRAPRLSWALRSDQPSDRPTAYQILVASSPELLAREIGDL